MGLCVCDKYNTTSVSWSYHTLHEIRKFAFMYCGLSNNINIDMFYDIALRRVDEKELSKMGFVKTNITYIHDIFKKASEQFPNLIEHSDCEGKYTKNGKINMKTFLTGNSIGLLNELKLLVDWEPIKSKNNEYHYHCLLRLYEVVKKIVEEGDGVIYFC